MQHAPTLCQVSWHRGIGAIKGTLLKAKNHAAKAKPAAAVSCAFAGLSVLALLCKARSPAGRLVQGPRGIVVAAWAESGLEPRHK